VAAACSPLTSSNGNDDTIPLEVAQAAAHTTPAPRSNEMVTLAELEQRVSAADSTTELKMAYDAAWASMTNKRKLFAWRFSENIGVALQMAWTDARTHFYPKTHDIRTEEMNWFLGFVEGKISAPVPEWWKVGMLYATSRPYEGHIVNSFFLRDVDYETSPAVGFKTAPWVLVTREGDNYHFDVRNKKVRVSQRAVVEALSKDKDRVEVFFTAAVGRRNL
jgi:hypothetical protein